MIDKATARAILAAYTEIEMAEKILGEVEIEIAKGENNTDFLRSNSPVAGRKCELGWPTFNNSGHRLYMVEPEIAKAVIVAHIADQKTKLVKLHEIAKLGFAV